MSNKPTLQEIEHFIINNDDLSVIKSHINKFNPIRVMKMERMEIRHSAILGWLLNPSENHGLDDNFLKAFLSQALSGYELDNKVSALAISSENLANANVQIEWNNIDIFIECPDQKWVFIIENKIDSSLHSNQLTRYKNFIELHFKNYEHIGILLSLYNESPDDESYTTLNYKDITHLIKVCLLERKDTLSTKVYNFIKYYEDIINELNDMNDDTEIKNIAKKLYREHKKVIDYIVEQGAETEFQMAVDSLINNGQALDFGSNFQCNAVDYRYFGKSKVHFSFLPISWIQSFDELQQGANNTSSDNFLWKGCKDWGAGYPILCWIELYNSTLRLYAKLGPLHDYSLRKKLIESIEGKDLPDINFQQQAKIEVPKTGSLFLNAKSYTETVNDVQNLDELKEKMETLLKKFGKDIVTPVAKQLDDFMKDTFK